MLDGRGDIEDHVPGVAVLHGLAVDAALQPDVLGVGHGAFVHEARPQRAERVQGLALPPLEMRALQVAGGHVQADGIAEDVVVGLGAGDVPALPADDHGQLHFPVDLAGDRMRQQPALVADDRGGRLGEEHRHLGRVELDSPCAHAFVDMFLVVDAQADDVLPGHGDRRQQPYAIAFDQDFRLRQPADALGIQPLDVLGCLLCGVDGLGACLDEGLHAVQIRSGGAREIAPADFPEVDNLIVLGNHSEAGVAAKTVGDETHRRTPSLFRRIPCGSVTLSLKNHVDRRSDKNAISS